MEFNGVIQKVMPKRSGVSERTGNAWERLPFIFEYKENQGDRYPDSVMLESYSTDAIKSIEKWMEKDANGNPVMQNGTINLTRPLYVHIGFCHKTRTFTNQQGETKVLNELSMYKFEWLKQPETPPTFQEQPPQQPQPEGVAGDDLPF